MPSASQHCADCRRELGEPFERVHEWLDAVFKVMGPKHRSARHHVGGLVLVRKMWGALAARAAEIRIMRDCVENVQNEQDAQMVRLCGVGSSLTRNAVCRRVA
jgi:hypothetical protein